MLNFKVNDKIWQFLDEDGNNLAFEPATISDIRPFSDDPQNPEYGNYTISFKEGGFVEGHYEELNLQWEKV